VNINHKLALAVSAAIGATTAAHAAGDAAADQSATAGGGLEEIIVTAQRRSENLQNVPITMQAISGDQLRELNVTTIEEAVKLLPNVTLPTNGPGQGNIYMRGLSSGFAGGQSSATIAPFPNVALYLDDQSMQFPARNADVYFADMERIEVLEGPQGTLFGGGAQAGAIRYITNKPNLDKVEGSANASYGFSSHGDPDSSANAALSVPVIPGTLALRAVIYSDHRGGYIDNVASTFTRKSTDAIPLAPPNSVVGNNFNIAQSASNPVSYTGGRLSGLLKINEDWNVLLSEAYQNLEADGVFTQFPIGSEGQPLKSWEVTAFSPAFDKDRYNNTALTINGKIGDIKLVYAGSYLSRHIDNQNDYTNYTRSAGGFYYTCWGFPPGVHSVTGNLGGAHPNWTPTCYSPIQYWRDQVESTHLSHELRASTPDDWRLRGIAGVYYEKLVIDDVMNFSYLTGPSCTPAAIANDANVPCVGTLTINPGAPYTNVPGTRPEGVAFGEDDQRGYKQLAFFASVDFDIIPKVLTVTAGTRHYNYANYSVGSVYSDTGCTNVPNGSCIAGGGPGAVTGGRFFNEHATDSGFRSRANITWHITPDVMVYYTFSQGFRSGFFNRKGGAAKAPLVKGGPGQLLQPHEATPDTLVNNEIGFKTELFDHRLQLNGSIYHMNWQNVQLLLFNPAAGLGNTTFPVNGPNFSYDGGELQFQARATDALTLMGSASYNHAKQTNSPCLIANNPLASDYGQCITLIYVAGANGGLGGQVPFGNPFGEVGGVPPNSPELQFNLRVRYDLTFNGYKAYGMVGANYVDSMYNQPPTYPNGDALTGAIGTTGLRYFQPSYTTYDASIGVARDNWTADVYGTNLGNSDASVFTSSAQFIKSEVPLHPRVVGLRVGYKF